LTPHEDSIQLAEIAERVARIASENSRLVQRFAEQEDRFRRLSRGVLRTQEAERRRISRELHDGVGQALTALKIRLDLLAQSANGRLSAEIDDARRVAESALRDVRQLSRLLRPQMLDDLGLLPTLLWLFRSIESTTHVRVEFAHEGIERRLDPDVETLAYRIVQEAVTNVVKHAQVAAVQVRARTTHARLLVAIQDRGAGFDATAAFDPANGSEGLGLRGMRDRAQLFGAQLSVYSTPGSGTLIELDVPLQPALWGPHSGGPTTDNHAS
jgi:two-component system, NarL family, sensor kinase